MASTAKHSEEKIQGLLTNFHRRILAMFYQVILMMAILEQFTHTFYWKLNKTTWPTSKRDCKLHKYQ